MGLLILILVGTAFYFAPSIVATLRGHKNELSITVANLFFGCTIVGWIVILIWACSNNTNQGE